jgi:uncharacterized protein YegJ (DUF2314 family)
LKYLVVLTLLIAPIALSEEQVQDEVVGVSADDRAMNAAIRKAQDTLEGFLAVFDKPPSGASGFKLKVRIEDSQGVEHFWVTPFRRTPQGFEGVIANDPQVVRSVRFGQNYQFSRTDISDWGYELNGKQKGSFTVCVMFTHMSKTEVDTYRRDYGFEC